MWQALKLCDKLWNYVAIFWNYVTISETIWKSLKLCDKLRNYVWQALKLFENLWYYVTISKTMWQFLKLCDNLINYVTILDTVWRSFTLCHNVWHCVTTTSDIMWQPATLCDAMLFKMRDGDSVAVCFELTWRRDLPARKQNYHLRNLWRSEWTFSGQECRFRTKSPTTVATIGEKIREGAILGFLWIAAKFFTGATTGC